MTNTDREIASAFAAKVIAALAAENVEIDVAIATIEMLASVLRDLRVTNSNTIAASRSVIAKPTASAIRGERDSMRHRETFAIHRLRRASRAGVKSALDLIASLTLTAAAKES